MGLNAVEEYVGSRVAIIGAGYTAREHLRAFQDVSGASTAGIFSRTRSRAESLASELGVVSICASIDELYERTKADLVVVCVSETATVEVCEGCFRYPWTLLVEKPPGLNAGESNRLLELAELNHSKALVALNRRFYSSTQSVLNDLSKRGGRRYVHIQDQQDLRRDPGPHHSQIVRDNWMYANSIHVIDLLRVFGHGNVAKVIPVFHWNSHYPGPVVAAVEFESGDIGTYDGIWNGPGPWSAAVSTDEVRWEMRPLEDATFQMAGTRKREPVTRNEWDVEFKPGFRLQAEMAIRSALGLPSESVTLFDAVQTMNLISQIFELN